VLLPPGPLVDQDVSIVHSDAWTWNRTTSCKRNMHKINSCTVLSFPSLSLLLLFVYGFRTCMDMIPDVADVEILELVAWLVLS
jgi:hypothetical protein